jgi:hypothetical protein
MKSREPSERLQAKLVAIESAVDDYFEGRPITSRCPNCGKLLEVNFIESVRSVWVTCPTGCTKYHGSEVKRDKGNEGSES